MSNQWQEYYKQRQISMEDAAKMVKSGMKMTVPLGASSVSSQMYNAVLDRYEELEGVKIIDAVILSPNKYMDPRFAAKAYGHITHIPGYGLGPIRRLYELKLSDYIPTNTNESAQRLAHLAEIWFVVITPPDKNGYVNLSLSNFYTSEGIRKGRECGVAKLVIAEVNDQMPVVFGDNWMHISEFDYFVEHSFAPPKYAPNVNPTEEEMTIAHYVTELIKDGDTIQMGIGAISEATTSLLNDKHDLGIITEMMVPSLPDLVEKGVITNKRKPLHTGTSLACFAIGDEKLYDYITENVAAQIYPGSYTNNPHFIARHPNVVSMNNAVMIDLTGQIASEGIGHRMISGVGGQFDFQLGAFWSEGGRACTLIKSAKKMADGTLSSAIVPQLPPGTPVSVPRTFADYIITEYGVANLRYKSLIERAEALIAIAHPDLRAELREAARKNLYPNL
jgi:4-hydroxybutyrate CoA-transferase